MDDNTLLNDARTLQRKPGYPCGVATTSHRLRTNDRTTLADLLEEGIEDPDIQATALARALKARGVDLPDFTISRHRRGDCSCAR